jgi:uncharacterized protein (TIGR03437 family)
MIEIKWRLWPLFFFFSSGWAQGIITTVAGIDFKFSSPPQPAIAAPLGAVTGVAFDGKGNLYVSDPTNSMVLKIAANGSLTVVAGTGEAGFSGDGGSATDAALNDPEGIAVDGPGNLYIADTKNNRIRMVDPAGVITTFAGNGHRFFSGDGRDAISASFNSPRAVAVDANGNVYIADWANDRVRMVSANGVITTVAGNGLDNPTTQADDGKVATQVSLFRPTGVAVDAAGNLLVAGDFFIRKITPTGIINSLPSPSLVPCSGDTVGVAVGANGNLFVTNLCSIVVKIDPSGFAVIVAGSSRTGFSGDGGAAISASLRNPSGVAADANNNLFIADTGNNRVRRISSGIIQTYAGNGGLRFGGDGGDARFAYLSSPRGVAASATGELLIADTGNNRIRQVSTTGTITTVAGTGAFFFSGDGGPAPAATLASPYGVAVDSKGSLYIADAANSRVRKVNPVGTISTILGGANGVAVSPQNNLFATDAKFVYELTPSGTASIVAGNNTLLNGFSGDGGPGVKAQLNLAVGVAADALGNVFIADSANNRVREVLLDGAIRTFAGGGNAFPGDGELATSAILSGPTGVAVDGAGNVFIAEPAGNRIRMVTSAGVINTVAGNGEPGFSGDGGLSTDSSLNAPQAVALDLDGNLFIADSGNNRIRKVSGAATPPLPGVIEIRSSATNKSGPIAPGSLISIFGSNLASTTSQATQFPLPRTLDRTQVLLGDTVLPILYASPGQLNVEVPFEVTADGTLPLRVVRNGSMSLPVQATLISIQPGILTVTADGTGQGLITKSDGFTLAQSATPAVAGETVVIYCTGLGSVTPQVATGVAAPLLPLSHVDQSVEVMIGGKRARVDFAGLVPKYSGLYQINAVVPDDVQPGNSVPVFISTEKNQSLTVTIAIR